MKMVDLHEIITHVSNMCVLVKYTCVVVCTCEVQMCSSASHLEDDRLNRCFLLLENNSTNKLVIILLFWKLDYCHDVLGALEMQTNLL